ncbi:retrovirus-related pol polyprotein from transposon TNT 1-94, partial [Tanacetum coccineum]
VTLFKIISYPEWCGDKPKTTRRGAEKGRGGSISYGNGGRGRNMGARANVAQVPHVGVTQETNVDKAKIEALSASHHIAWSLDYFMEFHNILECMVDMANGEVASTSKEGTISLGGNLRLKNFLCVPSLTCNLILVPKLLDDSNCNVIFTPKFCYFQDRTSRMVIGVGEQREGLFFLKGVAPVRAYKISGIGNYDLWHQRMGHPSSKIIDLLPKFNNCTSTDNSLKNKACDICFRSKQTRESFTLSDNKATGCFELIHCDLWGPYRTSSSCSARYFLTIVDDFSRGVWIFLLNSKDETQHKLPNFIALARRQFKKDVKIVRSDNVTEFTCLKSYFSQHGMIHQTSCPGTPQQNGRVERNRHILNVARALRWRLYDVESGNFFVSRDVAFVENEFPFKCIDEKAHSSDVIISDSLYVDDEVHQMGVESHSPHSPSNDSEDVDGKS